MNIVTRKAAIAGGLTHYFNGRPCPQGHIARRFVSSFGCVTCARERDKAADVRAYRKQWYDNYRVTPEGRAKTNEISARWRARNPEQMKAIDKAWRVANPEKVLAKNKVRAEKHAQYVVAHREWLAKHPGYMAEHARERQKLIARPQMPAWANPNRIAEIYANRPAGYHVDHIVPLKGRTVCGLHCEANLTYLPGVDNNNKYNKWPSDAAWVFHRNGSPTPRPHLGATI